MKVGITCCNSWSICLKGLFRQDKQDYHLSCWPGQKNGKFYIMNIWTSVFDKYRNSGLVHNEAISCCQSGEREIFLKSAHELSTRGYLVNFLSLFLTTCVTYGEDKVFVVCKNSYNSRKFSCWTRFINSFFKQRELTNSSIFIQFVESSIYKLFFEWSCSCNTFLVLA